MADGVGSGVELAPLRGKVVLDLTEFNEALEELESSVDSITDSLTESLESITNKLSEFRDQFKEPINIKVAVKDTKAVEQVDDALEEVQDHAKIKLIINGQDITDLDDEVAQSAEAIENASAVYESAIARISAMQEEYNEDLALSYDSEEEYAEAINNVTEALGSLIPKAHAVGINIDASKEALTAVIPLWNELSEAQQENFAAVGEEDYNIEALDAKYNNIAIALENLQGKYNEYTQSLQSATETTAEAGEKLAEVLNTDQEAFNRLKTSSDQAEQSFNSLTGKVDDLSESAEENAHEGEAWGEAWYEKATMVAFGLQMVVEQLNEIAEKSAQLSQVSSTTLPFLDAGSPGAIKSLENLINNSGSLGLDNNQVAGMIAQLTLALRQYGGTKAEVAGTTEEIIKMADQLDLATGGEISFEDAVEALRAELGGQSYSLETMGISISKTAENQAALNSQWHEAYSKLTPYEQKAIDMQVVQNSLNKTFGDTSKYLDSTAGKYLVAKANLSNAVTTLGVQLLPVLTSVFKELSQMITKIQDFTRWMEKAHPATLHVVADLGELALKVAPAIVGLALFGKTVSTIIKTARGVKTVATDFQKVFKIGTQFKYLSTDAGKAMLTIKKFGSTCLKTFESLGSKINPVLTGVGNVLKTGITTIFNGLRSVILKGISVLTDTVLPAIGEVIVAIGPIGWTLIALGTAVVVFYEAWQHNWFNIRGVTADVCNFIVEKWDSLVDSLEALGADIGEFLLRIGEAWDSGADYITNVLNTLSNDAAHIIANMMDSIGDFFEDGWNNAVSICENAGDTIVNTFVNIGSSMYNAGTNMINDLLSGLENAFGAVWSWADHAVSSLENILSHPLSSLENMFSGGNNFVVRSSFLAMPQPTGFMALPNPDMLIHNTTTNTVVNKTSTIQETTSTNNVPTIGELHLHSPNYIDPFETYNKMEELSRLYANGIYIGN